MALYRQQEVTTNHVTFPVGRVVLSLGKLIKLLVCILSFLYIIYVNADWKIVSDQLLTETFFFFALECNIVFKRSFITLLEIISIVKMLVE